MVIDLMVSRFVVRVAMSSLSFGPRSGTQVKKVPVQRSDLGSLPSLLEYLG